ncbi:TetR family transcriptional regulator [Bacillus sp. FJAT-18019]|uniref:TetR family transcriptional regulator n=1 Tax=Paenibacillus solani TaxID=1705565 RepID=A0A0M1N428_9BACL|nr:TetR/AcrR family transcriptional regulator [Paenibacillus solani]KOP65287.1 TetR family transcriptional regulator [Bacillus sp. FJAT-18019]KOR76739.1 TetR family transcriptional regulator [Paenibacillus solani]
MSKENDELGQKILDTAQALFDKYGVEDVSMHQVAKTAGIGQGTLYRRYPSKSKICFTLMEAKIDRFIEGLDVYLRESEEDLVAHRLRTVMTKVILHFNEDLEWLRVMLTSDRLEDTKNILCENPPFTYLRLQIQRLLELAAEREELMPLDPQFTSVMLASLPRADIILYMRDMGYSAEQIAEEYCRSFVDPLFIQR